MKWSGLRHPQQRVTFRPAISRSKTKKKRGSWTPGAVCVSDCFVWVCESVQYVFVGLCMCAFTSGGVFSMSYTNDSSGAGVFNFTLKKEQKAFRVTFSFPVR